jgi:hypothetical protein
MVRKADKPNLTLKQRAQVAQELANGASAYMIQRKYGISESSVYYIMRTCGIERRKWRRWTEQEDELIREHYPEHGGVWDGWARLMPERCPTENDLHARAHKLGVKRYG